MGDDVDNGGDAAHSPTRKHWWIELVIERAADLRNAGVTAIAVDGCSVQLLPKEPTTPKFDDIKNDGEQLGGLPPLLDPASYPDGIVPGFTITRLSDDDYDDEER
jgi:hypothetical protein